MISLFTSNFEKLMCKNKFTIDLYNLYYRKTLLEELKILNITKEDRVLCIGGGSIPSTAMEIASLTKADVSVLDRDMESVRNGRRSVAIKGIENLQVIHSKGENFDLSDYSVVHIALQVDHKEVILNEILKYGSDQVRVMIRQPKKIIRGFYDSLSHDYIGRNKYKCIHGMGKGFKTMREPLLLVTSK